MNLNNKQISEIQYIFNKLHISSFKIALKKPTRKDSEITSLISLFIFFADFFQSKFKKFLPEKELFTNEKSLSILSEEKEHLIAILKDPISFLLSSTFRPECFFLGDKFFLKEFD